jgi:hypothetical protein
MDTGEATQAEGLSGNEDGVMKNNWGCHATEHRKQRNYLKVN